MFRPDAVQAAAEALATLRTRGVEVGGDRESASEIGVPLVEPGVLADCDLIISFGGDGTLLQAAHVASERGTPIMGVYFGRFGFVTQFHPHEMGAALSAFLDGQMGIEARAMVQAELIRNDKVVATLHCLNEVVVQRAATTRMLTFDVQVNDLPLARYPADGVMVATPTGSTAYNLSAGGPVVDPAVEAMILTAVTPHTLSARPLVLRSDAVLRIDIETRGDAVLSGDGQSRLHLLSGDAVRVTRSPRQTRLVVPDRNEFFDKLANHFQWSRGPRGV